MPLRGELEVMAAGLAVIDPEVAAERDRTRTRESQVQGELGQGPAVLFCRSICRMAAAGIESSAA